jgi:nucleoside-diphosphate-sugar epimerase
VVPRRRDYDLTREADVERLFGACQPRMVVHLAAVVGGIGPTAPTRDGSPTKIS